MAFVNEYASDEDIERYKLKEIWDKFHPHERGRYFRGHKPALTIDRERNIFLMTVGQGTGEAGNRTMFLISLDGVVIRFDLNLARGTSLSWDDRPFLMVWDLAFLDVPPHLSKERNEVIELIRDAMRAYGYRGPRAQIPETVVKLNF